MIWKLLSVLLVSLVILILCLLIHQQLELSIPINIAGIGLLHSSGNIKPEIVYTPSLPSIERMFGSNHEWVATLSASQVRTIIATGDVIPARSVNFQETQRKDFKWPYLKTAEVLKQADITFINLETPLLDNCSVTQEGMIFCGNYKNIEGLIYAGVDIVSLANNHAGNHGVEGVQKTVNLLNQNGIIVTGISGPIFREIRGLKFAFLGYNDVGKIQPGVSNVDEEVIKHEIKEVRNKADVVIVTYHWGTEYQAQPDDRQKYLGHLAIDTGADLVIGNHPHWIQPVEIYKGKLITYAHGNFVFDQMWSQTTREGIIGKYMFFDKELVDVEYLPVQINDFGQPSFVDQDKAKLILDRIKNESIRLSNNL